jgi:hypothetical protein
VARQYCWELVLLLVIMSWPLVEVDSPGGRAEAAHRQRVPMAVKTAGRVGCRRSWYCFAIEMPIGNPGTCAHSFDELW